MSKKARREPSWRVSVDGGELLECYGTTRDEWDEIVVPANLITLMLGKRLPLRFERAGQVLASEGVVTKVVLEGDPLSTIALSGPLREVAG